MTDLRQIWRQPDIPVIFRRVMPVGLLVKLPYSSDNRTWLRGDQIRKPNWTDKFSAWACPQAWFERAIYACLNRYGTCYVVQAYRELQVCAPACWNAVGLDCECSCMGANHGQGHPEGRWYEIAETLAISWGEQHYAVRLLRR